MTSCTLKFLGGVCNLISPLAFLDNDFFCTAVVEMDKVPSELHYRGDEHGTLAIVADGSEIYCSPPELGSCAFRSIHVCNHTQGSPAVLWSDQHFEPAKNCCISGLEWGKNRTSDLLFVTWQPQGTRKFVNRQNYHQSLGVQDGSPVYNFSTSTNPGSALGLSPDGLPFF